MTTDGIESTPVEPNWRGFRADDPRNDPNWDDLDEETKSELMVDDYFEQDMTDDIYGTDNFDRPGYDAYMNGWLNGLHD